MGAALLAMFHLAEGSCLDSESHSVFAESDLTMVEYRGTMYPLPIARGVWQSPRVPFEVIDILLREKMGIRTATFEGLSSEKLLREVSGCSNSSLECSEKELAAGEFQAPPAVWAANEVWTSTVEESRLRKFVSGASLAGYVSTPGLRALPSSYSLAKSAGIILAFWESLLLPRTKACCFSDVVDVRLAMSGMNYSSQIADGTAGYAAMQLLNLSDHVEDGWYISTACRSNTSMCIPVVLGEFEWNMREWIYVAEINELPFAITAYGWVTGAMTAVPKLAEQNLTFLFYWWQPDSTFDALSPQMVIFREEMLTIKQYQPTEKVVWDHILEVDRGEDILNFLSRATFSSAQMDQFVTRQKIGEDASGIACQWIQDNEATWSSWIPDTTNCEKGFFYDSVDAMRCTGCAPGRYAPNRGMTACMNCSAGEFQAQVGRAACEPCLAGTSSAGAAAACVLCALGRWQNETGQGECRACDGGGRLSTEWPGSTSESECVCPRDTYRPLEASAGALCESCPEGMTCALGSDAENIVRGSGPFAGDLPPFPQLQPGYMSLASDPMRVFRCLPEGNCPGGGTASCAALRDSEKPACGECMDGSYSSGGVCHECQAMDGLPFVFLGVLATVGIGLLTIAVNHNLLLQSKASIQCVVTLGLLFSGIQKMGIFDQLSIAWTGPMQTIFDIVVLMSFDLQILQTGCIMGSNPVSTFIMRQVVAPGCIPVIFLVLVVKKTAWFPNTNINIELINTVGTVFNIFFISIVISGVSPFICYKHPGYSGDWSMASATSILCFEDGRHGTMMAVGILSLLLVPLPFLACACYFVLHYPRFLEDSKTARSRQAMQAMRFMYFRYRPPRYFYGLILLFKCLTICLVPVVIRDDVALQIFAMVAVLCFSTLQQQQLNPWRNSLANWMDGAQNILLVMLLLSGAMAANLQAKPSTVEFVGLSSVFFVFAFAGSLIFWGLYNRITPRQQYQYFICHHKADAAAQARLLKMKLQAKTHQSVFIDSDNLTELDDLFDIVKCNLKHLVVYLTRDTLGRVWCAGEIATAFQTGRVKVTAVRTPSFVPLTEDQLDRIDEILDLTSCTLEEYGISFDHVRYAYERLLSAATPQLRLKEGGVHNLDILVDHMSKQSKNSYDISVSMSMDLPPLSTKDLEGAVTISCDHTDMEASAAATILSTRIQERSFVLTDTGTLMLQDYQLASPAIYGSAAKHSHAIIVLLSQGSMKSAAQLKLIIEVMYAAAQLKQGSVALDDDDDVSPHSSASVTSWPTTSAVVVPVFIDGFRFPDDSYYDEDLPRILQELAGEARPLIKSFFKTIALPFSTGASDHLLKIQSQEVLKRIPKVKDSSRNLLSRRGSRGSSRSRASSAGTVACEEGQRSRRYRPRQSVTVAASTRSAGGACEFPRIAKLDDLGLVLSERAKADGLLSCAVAASAHGG